MRIFLGDGGTTWAATYEMSGYNVLEFETECSDGFVVGTGNNELAGRLTWPPEFDVRHEAFESAPSLLAEKHRQRVRTRLAKSPQSLLRVCDTLQDVVASQNRQQRTKHAFRRSIGYLSEDEFRRIATDMRLSRRAAKAIFTEYERLAKEGADAAGRHTMG